jgi:hypothetical protein
VDEGAAAACRRTFWLRDDLLPGGPAVKDMGRPRISEELVVHIIPPQVLAEMAAMRRQDLLEEAATVRLWRKARRERLREQNTPDRRAQAALRPRMND